MLKTILTRHVSAEFTVNENGQEVLVKSVAVNFDADAVPQVSEALHSPKFYNKHRHELRKDEQALRELRYQIEDAILAEKEAAAANEEVEG
jgi:hypothetical protein